MKIAKNIHDKPVECTGTTHKFAIYHCYICGEVVHPCNDKKLGEGRKKDYYFSHFAGNCSANLESYIHNISKEIIAAAREILLPGKLFTYSAVELECNSLHPSIRPDALLDKEVGIEICYTNPKTDKQIRAYKDLNFSAVEIYLEMLDMNSSLDEITHAVLLQNDNRIYLSEPAELTTHPTTADPHPLWVLLFIILAFFGIKTLAMHSKNRIANKRRVSRKYPAFRYSKFI